VASADIFRVRPIERASWRLLDDEILSPSPRARDVDRQERTNHTRCFLCISGDQARKRRTRESALLLRTGL
jgi:hypothetical protein